MTPARRRAFVRLVAALFAVVSTATAVAAQQPYFPPPGDAWERRTPEQMGFTKRSVDSAVTIALKNESTAPRDLLANHQQSFGREPMSEAIGPFKERGGAAGMIVRRGYILAEWGDPNRVDVTYSVTKSFVTTTIGLAFDRKMIRAVTDKVGDYMAPIVVAKNGSFSNYEVLAPFESEHNRKITWEHLLRQTSDWQGTLWGKPDWVDRFPRNTTDTASVINRARFEPGTRYTYNDVRVNLMALASLNVWRRPLPEVLKEYVMDPIGASNSWRWYGYDNSWVILDGRMVQSVAGGAHWGGGMFINARDMARFGLLTLRDGKWNGKQVLSQEWIRMSRSPGPANDAYGFANYFLNTGKKALPDAPESAFWHLGNGNNIIYVDPVNDLVIVTRWLTNTRALNDMIKVLTTTKS